MKAPHLVSITVWRREIRGPITQPPSPPAEGTGVYEVTMTRCPKCGAENSPSAKFCRNCGTSLTPKTLPKPS